MTESAGRPLLFLDVDGTLLPFGAAEDGAVRRLGAAPAEDDGGYPRLHRLNPEHGPQLVALPCELVWATAWMADANEDIGPRIGLPELPVVEWSDPSEDEDDRLHWKTRDLVAWAAGRPFVWVDDEITDIDRAWVAEHHDGHALLLAVDSGRGLTDTDIAVLGDWLRAL